MFLVDLPPVSMKLIYDEITEDKCFFLWDSELGKSNPGQTQVIIDPKSVAAC